MLERSRKPIAAAGDRRTQSQHKNACSLKSIMQKCVHSGVNPVQFPSLDQFEGVPRRLDYAEAFAIVEAAQTSFQTVPARIREHFQNDPLQFLNAIDDTSRIVELQEIGLFKKSDNQGEQPSPPVPLLVVTGGTDTKPTKKD